MPVPLFSFLARKPTAGQPAAGTPVSKMQLLLKQKLLKESMLLACALGVLAAAVYGVALWAESRQDSENKLMSSVNQITAEADQLRLKMSKLDKAVPIYESVFAPEGKNEIPLERPQLTQVLGELKDEYLFSAKLNMSLIRTLEEGKYKNAHGAVQVRELQLTIEALSDEHVIDFLQALKARLPGKLKIIHLAFSKKEEPGPAMLVQIANTGTADLVGAEVRMLWMGIQKPTSSASAAPPQEQ